MTAKEILQKIKAAFVGEATTDPAAAPTTVQLQTKVYKLSDGSEVSIDQATEILAVGDMVTVGGALPVAGDYTLEDGQVLVVDAAGKITEIKPAPPVTTELNQDPANGVQADPVVQAPTAMTSEFPKTPEELTLMCAAFANGTPEERIANLEKVAKALMENCFGWQLREAEQKAAADQAILIYKQGLVTAETSLQKHEKTITDLFELVEKLIDEPTADPVTLTGNKKDQFDRMTSRDRRLKKIAEARKQIQPLS